MTAAAVAMTYPKRVLIVEDDLMVADLLEQELIDAGFEVCGIASTVSAAIEAAERTTPALMIVDINLAGFERGTEIYARIRRSWRVGIIYASGTANFAQLADSGGSAVMLKPYSITEMVAALTIVGEIVAGGNADEIIAGRPMPRSMRLLPNTNK